MVPGLRVSVAKEYLSFSSAHFIALPGHQCEALHGHNYRVGVTVDGGIGADGAFVVDFGVIKGIVRPLVQEIDHRVLLPAANPRVRCEEAGDELRVVYQGRVRFVFPRTNCVLLPVEETSAELLAGYFARRVAEALRAGGVTHLTAVEIEVEESPGQSGSCRLGLGA